MSQQVNVQEMSLRTEGVPAVDLPLYFPKTDRTWEDKYGITTVPLLVRSASGELYDDRRLKAIFINGQYRRPVSRRYVVYPNEEVDTFLREHAHELNMTIRNTYESNYGDARYWELLSEEITENVEYAGVNDAVRVGAIVRNSLGTNIALGADLYTWRVFCQNGAVARGKDMGFALRHVGGDPEKLINAFKDGISRILKESQGLVEYYRKAAKLRMNKKIAEELKKRIPVRALPDCMVYDHKTHKASLTREDDLWTAFNDVTRKVWHNEKVGFVNKADIEKATHTVLIRAVQGKYQ